MNSKFESLSVKKGATTMKRSNHDEKEQGMTSKTETDDRMWQAGYDAGFEDGRRQAVQAMRSLWKMALDAKIDALAEPISRGTS